MRIFPTFGNIFPSKGIMYTYILTFLTPLSQLIYSQIWNDLQDWPDLKENSITSVTCQGANQIMIFDYTLIFSMKQYNCGNSNFFSSSPFHEISLWNHFYANIKRDFCYELQSKYDAIFPYCHFQQKIIFSSIWIWIRREEKKSLGGRSIFKSYFLYRVSKTKKTFCKQQHFWQFWR